MSRPNDIDEDIDKKTDVIERRYEEEALFKDKNREDFRVIEEVFDRLTVQGILRFFKRGIIKDLHGVVKTGKEARVYFATDKDDRELAIKIYYTHTAEFRKGMMQYIQGDPRFKRVRKQSRAVIYTWNQKEYSNLQLCFNAGVNSPEPIAFYRNILVMTFIGEDGLSTPLLRELDPEDPSGFYELVLHEMQLMWQKAGLVHGDLSEYNIMVQDEKPVIFDVSQAMLTGHPMANMLIERDIQNINNYFSRLDVETRDPKELKEWITGGTEDVY
ncbi:MAG: serine protein kinase RIO [Candidatus Bathyarchaeota archaeon]|nr:serine protein kinase RIO [Candidatus Bathyarchaeota archaeon]